MIAQDARDAVMVIADPESAEAAVAVGVGAMVDLSVGGKVDQRHGEPVAVRGVVRRITDGRWIHEGPENAGAPADMGPTAVVAIGGVDIVLTSCKSMPGDLAQLRSVGIEPAERQIIVVKSAVRWRGGYGPIAKHAIDVDTPGLGSVDLSRFEFRRLRRPIWPLDPDFAWSPEPVIGV